MTPGSHRSVVAEYGLLLDIQGTQSVQHGERGIARFVAEHAMALMRRSERVRCLLLNPLQPFPSSLPPPLLTSERLTWNSASALRIMLGAGGVALHVMSPFELPDPSTSVVPDHLMRPELPIIVTLYDLIPYLFPERYFPDPAQRRRYVQRVELVRGAELVLAISEATRQDAIRHLGMPPSAVVNIGGGVSPVFRPAPAGAAVEAMARHAVPEIRRPYFFCVAGAEYRKNAERLIEAYAMLPADVRRTHQLVITCALPPGWKDAWLEHARKHGCAEGDLVLTGRVSDEVLVRLYRGAALFVFPSLYEGFGLPVAEAIACACPTVTSHVSSLPEILDYPPATFDPEDAASISQSMERGVSDPAFRAELMAAAERRAPQFRWDAVADRTLAAIRTRIDSESWRPDAGSAGALPAGRRHRRSGRPGTTVRRPRVALVTPLPPQVGGVASYSARLLPHLAEHLDLDVLHPGPETPDVRDGPVRILPLAGLGRYVNPHVYDAVVYAIGNSPHHVPTYEKLRMHRGIVWLHEIRFHHLVRHHAGARKLDLQREVRELLHRNYGMRTPVRAFFEWEDALAERFGLGFAPEIVRASRGVIVHSALAERLLRLDLGPDSLVPPIRIVPHAAAPARPSGPVPRRLPVVVGALGIVDERKAPLLLIDAIAETPQERRPLLRFIGPCSATHREWLLEHAAERGVVEHVACTGRVGGEEWWAAIDSLTCAVQLRTGTSGESSGSVRDAMARGVPVITNMVAADDEFPRGSLFLVPQDVDGTGLAEAIRAVSDDAGLWARLSRAGWEYSGTLTEAVVAAQLAATISQLSGRDQP